MTVRRGAAQQIDYVQLQSELATAGFNYVGLNASEADTEIQGVIIGEDGMGTSNPIPEAAQSVVDAHVPQEV